MSHRGSSRRRGKKSSGVHREKSASLKTPSSQVSSDSGISELDWNTPTRYGKAIRRRITGLALAAVIGAFTLEGTARAVQELLPGTGLLSNLISLCAMMMLISPVIYVIIFVQDRPVLRAACIIAAVCLVMTSALNITASMQSLKHWPLIGAESHMEGLLEWLTLVIGIGLLVGSFYFTIGELVKARESLQIKHRGLAQEVRERKRMEKTLRSARDLAENLIQNANVMVIGVDADRRLTIFNQEARRITGYAQEELSKGDWFEQLVPPEQYPNARAELRRVMTSGLPRRLEGRIRTKSGEERHIVWSNSEIREGGRFAGTISFGLDVTDRKQAEAELLRSSKLAALGTVAAGLAHEIGNPLASLSARLHLLEEEDDPAFLKESLELLQRQIARIARIVHGVSRFSRPPSSTPIECDVNSLVSEALSVLQFHEGAKRCRIETELTANMPLFRATADELIQVFLNLGLNAIDAMPEGGALTVKTLASEESIEIAFRDTGKGFEPGITRRMFDTFFTSKEHGLGLGLSISHNIVAKHGGRIQAENASEGGACFTVFLPRNTASRDIAKDQPAETNQYGRV